ncbi:MAG: OmpA family protein [Polyangiaceae bacterium]
MSRLSILLAAGMLALGCASAPPPPSPEPTPLPAPPPAAPVPAPPASSTTPFAEMRFSVNDKGEVEIPKPVLFETGTARLERASDEALDIVLDYLNHEPTITKLRVEGHTDTEGSNASNLTLSKNRAMAVVRWLVAKGIDCRRLVPVGFGEERLVVSPEETEEDKAKNRRVVFVNAEKDGTALPLGEGGASAGDPCD